MDRYIPFILIPFIGWGVWRHLRKKNDLSPLKVRTFYIGIIFFFITELGRSFYRPYIYEQNIQDFYFADTIGTITAIFMILTLSGTGTTKDWKIVTIILVGLMGYEFLNISGFDINDIYATLIFGMLSILIYAYLLKKFGNTGI